MDNLELLKLRTLLKKRMRTKKQASDMAIYNTYIWYNQTWYVCYLFKKIRDTKGKFHAKMGLIKDRNGMDLREAEAIKRWQEYTAAKSLQLCPTLCDLIDGSPPGSRISGILQARTLEWVAISFSNEGMGIN